MHGGSWRDAEDVKIGGKEGHWLQKAEEVMEGLKQTHTPGIGALFSPSTFLPHFLLQLASLWWLFCHSCRFYFPVSTCRVTQAHPSAHSWGFTKSTSSGNTAEDVLSVFFQ